VYRGREGRREGSSGGDKGRERQRKRRVEGAKREVGTGQVRTRKNW